MSFGACQDQWKMLQNEKNIRSVFSFMEHHYVHNINRIETIISSKNKCCTQCALFEVIQLLLLKQLFMQGQTGQTVCLHMCPNVYVFYVDILNLTKT